jgi:hypothetical protein
MIMNYLQQGNESIPSKSAIQRMMLEYTTGQHAGNTKESCPYNSMMKRYGLD